MQGLGFRASGIQKRSAVPSSQLIEELGLARGTPAERVYQQHARGQSQRKGQAAVVHDAYGPDASCPSAFGQEV